MTGVAQRLIEEALAVLPEAKPPVRNGFGPRASRTAKYSAARTRDGEAAVLAGPMISSSFRLLDAAVNHRMTVSARKAVVFVSPPPNAKRGVDDEYLRRYQGLVEPLGVVWLTKEGDRVSPYEPERRSHDARELDRLADDVQRAIAAIREPIPPTRRSAACEEILIDAVTPALRNLGFELSASRSFRGFWRSPRHDGLFERAGRSISRLALEIKCDEDLDAPLGQVAEDLAAFDAVLQIRAGQAERTYDALAEEAQAKFESVAPVRYLRWS